MVVISRGTPWRTIDWTLNMLQHRCCFRFPLLSLRTCLKIEVSNLQKKNRCHRASPLPTFSNPSFSCPWKVAKPPKGKDRLPLQSFFRGELLNFGRVKKQTLRYVLMLHGKIRINDAYFTVHLKFICKNQEIVKNIVFTSFFPMFLKPSACEPGHPEDPQIRDKHSEKSWKSTYWNYVGCLSPCLRPRMAGVRQHLMGKFQPSIGTWSETQAVM